MAKKPIPTPAALRQLLRYEPETGKLFWLERGPDGVRSPRASTRVRLCKNWNARYAGKEVPQTPSIRGHAYVVVAGCKLLTHRAIWAIHHGSWPQYEIDHINGDPTDNRIANLRDVPHFENMRNTRLDFRNKTGACGIWWDEKKRNYQTYISKSGERVALGRFKTLDEAKAARKAAEIILGYHKNHGRRPALNKQLKADKTPLELPGLGVQGDRL